MAAPRILAFAGSLRTASWNKKLIAVAAESARRAGAGAGRIDLRDYSMPMYDGDIEGSYGLPANAIELKQQMIAHDGFLLSCPEYNSSISAVLKNSLDWISRPQPGEPTPSPFRGKVAALMSASPGNLGGIRGLFTVRQILTVLGTIVLPTQFGLARANAAFNEDGTLVDPGQLAAIDNVTAELVSILGRLKL